ncbi:MAG: chemotaxis-specific protein-glutamate methyltransferase CheB [Deltaproteobacteria bacterium]|nr:chemotaxis-specific protein-glutamate methyltransferase CheB [Deltaproteobacteria bacterium]
MTANISSSLRILVIDDSAYNRQAIIEMIESCEDIEVVGMAANGEEGLKSALTLKPDVITLDLEMPKMDGFTFLRILMSRRPTPVIVISSYARKQNVFKALELGALDFIAKPTRYLSPELHKIRDELIEKVMMVRHLRSFSVQLTSAEKIQPGMAPGEPGEFSKESPRVALVVIGASTGGPPALQNLLQMLPPPLPAAYLIAQHMPENFTRAFADRLNRYTGLEVSEAQGGEQIVAGRVFISPGGQNLAVFRDGPTLKTVIQPAIENSKYTPSIDTLFQSAAEVMGRHVMGILLTGMGSDGKKGMRAIKNAGGKTLAESEETAVIFGMPKEAIESGQVDIVCRLDDIAGEVVRFSDMICDIGIED